MKPRHYLLLAIIFIWFILIGAIAMKAGASVKLNNGDECDQGVHRYNPHCVTPTPTVCQKATPTVTPTPTQEVTPTPQITETPTVSPTPEPVNLPIDTPVAGQSGTQGSSSPICTAGDFPRPFGLTFVSRDGDKVTFSRVKSADTGVDHQVAYIGLQNGVPNGAQVLDKNDQSVTFNYVPHQTVWAMIEAVKGNCIEHSDWIDP